MISKHDFYVSQPSKAVRYVCLLFESVWIYSVCAGKNWKWGGKSDEKYINESVKLFDANANTHTQTHTLVTHCLGFIVSLLRFILIYSGIRCLTLMFMCVLHFGFICHACLTTFISWALFRLPLLCVRGNPSAFALRRLEREMMLDLLKWKRNNTKFHNNICSAMPTTHRTAYKRICSMALLLPLQLTSFHSIWHVPGSAAISLCTTYFAWFRDVAFGHLDVNVRRNKNHSVDSWFASNLAHDWFIETISAQRTSRETAASLHTRDGYKKDVSFGKQANEGVSGVSERKKKRNVNTIKWKNTRNLVLDKMKMENAMPQRLKRKQNIARDQEETDFIPLVLGFWWDFPIHFAAHPERKAEDIVWCAIAFCFIVSERDE